ARRKIYARHARGFWRSPTTAAAATTPPSCSPASRPSPSRRSPSDRGAPRFIRGATSVGGWGGHFGAPSAASTNEERHESFEARRALGGGGAISGPRQRPVQTRSATIHSR